MEKEMKSISVHNLDDQLSSLIASRAKKEGLSMNRMIKKLLAESLGMKLRDESTRYRDFEEFCGTWNEADQHEFDESTSDFRRVDNGDWQ